MLEHYLQPFIDFLHIHPYWGGVFAFTISFIESLALIGTIMPGSVTMTAVGALIGAGILPGAATFAWAIAGAYAGDCLSYWAGLYYNVRLRSMWPFNKHGKWLILGEDYFRKHGGKSVVIGRFVGPIRSLIPLIAGLLKMPPGRFLPFAFASATLWAIVYMLPGILLGALALELPPKVATQFVLLSLLSIALLWGAIWAIKYFIQTSWGEIDRLFMRLWNYLNTHQRSHWITQLLRNPAHEEDHMQLALAVCAIATGVLFLWVVVDVATYGWLARLNVPLYTLLQSFRLKSLDHAAIAITLLGYVKLLLVVAAILGGIGLWRRYFWEAWHWLAITLFSAGSIGILKKLVSEPRPPLVQDTILTGSFPSGHTTLSTALFGFLAVIIAHHLPAERRTLPYWWASIVVGLIAFSRLYLGAHWFTDILASIFLGLTWMLLLTLSYRRRTPSQLAPGKLTLTITLIFLIAWTGFALTSFKFFQQQFNPPVPTRTLTAATTWWEQKAGELPWYRTNRFGAPAQPLNVQWLGTLATIEQALVRQDWQTQSVQSNLHGALLRISSQTPEERLPPLLGLYHNRNPVLLMTKANDDDDDDQPTLVLRLWQSDIHIDNSDKPLWLGTVNYYTPPHKLIRLPNRHRQIQELQNAANALTAYLQNFQWRTLNVPFNQQPPALQHLKWDGNILLIRDKR